MKRYVTEFAHDVINNYENNTMINQDVKTKKKDKIESIIFDYELGLITSTEAVYMISHEVLGY